MIDTFLFDLDGTLADSVPLILACSKRTQAELAIPWDEGRQLSLIGKPIWEIGAAIAGPGQEQHYIDVYQKHYHHMHDALCQPFPGIPQLLQQLQQAGATLAVVTSRRQEGTYRSLEHMGLTNYFQAIICAEQSASHKPEPGPALVALAQLGKDPTKAVFIGDSFYDLRCGRQAGTQTCGVTWGAGTLESIQAEMPDYIATTVADLSSWLHQKFTEEK